MLFSCPRRMRPRWTRYRLPSSQIHGRSQHPPWMQDPHGQSASTLHGRAVHTPAMHSATAEHASAPGSPHGIPRQPWRSAPVPGSHFCPSGQVNSPSHDSGTQCPSAWQLSSAAQLPGVHGSVTTAAPAAPPW